MKLHLPKALFTAVIAAFAVSQTVWGFDGPTETVDGVTTPVSYESGTLPETVGTADSTITLEATEDTVWDGSSAISASGLTFDINASGCDVKLLAPTSANERDVNLNSVQSSTLWLAKGAWKVDNNDDLKDAGTIYLGGAQMQLLGDAAGGRTLANDFVLGTSTTLTHSDYGALNYSSLRVGVWDQANKTHKLTGTVTVQEATKIAFQAGNNLILSGTIKGSGGISLAAYNSSSSLILSGNTSNFTGVVALDSTNTGTVSLKLGADAVQTGGLSGNLTVGLDTVGKSTLTLNVASDTDVTYSGTLADGIAIVKKGAGTQTLSGQALSSGVTVEAGILNIENATTLAGAISITGGTLNVHGMDMSDVTSLSLSDGATLGISKAIDGSNGTFDLNGKLAIIEGTSLTSAFAVDTTKTTYASATDGTGSGAVSGYATGDVHYIIADGVTAGANLSIEGYDSSAVSTENNKILLSVGTGSLDASTFYINEDAAWGSDGYTDNTATTYVVATGKTFDAKWTAPPQNGSSPLQGKDLILNTGATLKNTGEGTGTSWAQFKNMTIQGDAYVDGDKNIGLLGPGYDPTTLTLNGYTLTKKGSSTFYMINTTTDAGVIDIQGGAVHVGYSSKTTDASAATFKLSGGNLFVNQNTTLKVGGLTGTSTTSVVKADAPGAGATAGMLELTGAGDFTSAASLTGSINLKVNKGSGTQTLGVSSTWTGSLTLTSGTLKLNMADDLTLAHSNISRTNGKLVLNGGGTYTITDATLQMSNATDSNNLGVSVGDNWSGKVVITNTQIGGSHLEHLGRAGSTLKFVGYNGWMNSNGVNILSNIELENYSGTDADGNAVSKSAFIFDDNSTGWNYKFGGAVSGSGDFQIASQAGSAAHIHFTGSTEDWEGGIIVTNAYEKENQTPAQKNSTPTINVNLTGGGDIFSAEENKGFVMDRASTNADSTNIVNLNIGHASNDSTMNGAISMGENADENAVLNLAVKGNTTFKKDVEVTSLTVDANKTATLEGATTTGTLTGTGAIEVTGANAKLTQTGTADTTLSSLTLTDGATYEGAGATNITLLSLSTGLSDTKAAVSTSGALTLGTVSIDLTGYTAGDYILATTVNNTLTYNADTVNWTNLADGMGAELRLLSTNALDGTSGTTNTLVLTLSNPTIEDGTLTATGILGYDEDNNVLTLMSGLTKDSFTLTATEDAIISEALWKDIVNTVVQTEGGDAEISLQFTYANSMEAIDLGALGVTNLTINGNAAVGGTATIVGSTAGKYLIPEPTSTTLSLLALAALAVRRRRR